MIDQFLVILGSRMASSVYFDRAELGLGYRLGSRRDGTRVNNGNDRWCEVVRRVEAFESDCGTKCTINALDLVWGQTRYSG